MQQLVSRLVDPDSLAREHCEVIGIAELHGHLYVLQNKSKSIHVSLADKPYTMLGDVALDGALEPTDLAASLMENCLYITDSGENGCVWRVQVEERVAETCPERVELKLAQNASGFEGMSPEASSAAGTESAQGSAGGYDREVKQRNSTDTGTACTAADEASAAEHASVTNVDEPVSKTQEETSQPFIRDSEAGIDLQQFIQMITGCQVSAVNISEATPHKSESSSASKAKRAKDDDAGEMIRSLLERTGVMKKIAERERENAGPRVFEITRHYDAQRFLFNIDVIFYCWIGLC